MVRSYINGLWEKETPRAHLLSCKQQLYYVTILLMQHLLYSAFSTLTHTQTRIHTHNFHLINELFWEASSFIVSIVSVIDSEFPLCFLIHFPWSILVLNPFTVPMQDNLESKFIIISVYLQYWVLSLLELKRTVSIENNNIHISSIWQLLGL